MPQLARAYSVAVVIALASASAPIAGCSKSNASPSDAGETTHADAAIVDGALPPLTYDFSALETAEFGGAWVTEGLIVQHRGVIVYEKYAAGFTATMRHFTYSVSKSIGGALVGIAIDEGLMQKTDSVCKYITQPTGADPTLCDTTIEQLLHMTPGLFWNENDTDPSTSSDLELLYGNESDMGAYAAVQSRVAEAGTVFNYSSGTTDLLADAFKGALKGQDPRAWAQAKLFGPAGITSALFEEDRAGTPVFSTYCYLTPRDMVKFGQLFLTDGMAGTTRVLPAGWAAYASTPGPAVSTPTPRSNVEAGTGYGGSYGAQFWLNAASPTATQDTWEYPDEPIDGFQAEGHFGQKIVIIPSRDLVVVRVGSDRVADYDPDGTDQLIGAAVAAIDKATHQGDD